MIPCHGWADALPNHVATVIDNDFVHVDDIAAIEQPPCDFPGRHSLNNFLVGGGAVVGSRMSGAKTRIQRDALPRALGVVDLG